MELLVPTVSDVIYKYTWPILKYKKTVSKNNCIDSAPFSLNINGIQSSWNLSIRFWKGPEGKRITNPVVLCLNILKCTVEEVQQAKIRYQFAVFNSEVNCWDYCNVNRTSLEFNSNLGITSLGYRDLSIINKHLKKNGQLNLQVKIQVILCESEKNNLAQDMSRLLRHPKDADTKVICATPDAHIYVHSNIISARSSILANMILPKEYDPPQEALESVNLESENKEDKPNTQSQNDDLPNIKFTLELLDLTKEIVEEFLRYIYTDHVDNLDALAPQLVSLSERFHLKGLKELCERNLIETLKPENVATRLLLAEEFSCDGLKRAGLAYCEENAMSISKNFTWKMMEQVNPELFNEVCEASIGSSRSSSMDESDLSS